MFGIPRQAGSCWVEDVYPIKICSAFVAEALDGALGCPGGDGSGLVVAALGADGGVGFLGRSGHGMSVLDVGEIFS